MKLQLSCIQLALAQSKPILTRSYSTVFNTVRKEIAGELSQVEKAGTYKRERVILGQQGVTIEVAGAKGKILNFCANNYLGLSSHPDVVAAAQSFAQSHGAGLSSVRFICGTQNIHRQLEQKLADFHCREDTILYASCFDANGGIFEVLMTKDDVIITDELNHASIIDGIRLSKAHRLIYKHMDMQDLQEKLKASQSHRRRLIVTDGVFSMDGDVAPLKTICDLADSYGAMVFVDDCHATGFFGATGRGTEEYFGIQGRVDIINSTLGKALGGAMGGYTASSKELVDLLRQRSRPYLFSNSLAPAVVGAASKVMDMLLSSSEYAQSVMQKARKFRKNMIGAGFKVIGHEDHPICPVMLGDAKLAGKFADLLLEKGIYVIGFSYPVVPMNKARIRVQISAAHTDECIDKAVSSFIAVGKSLSVI